jgi:Tfp pilus assembly protein PilV
MERIIRNESGVTIIEILISMVLIAIALFTIVAVFPKMSTHRKVVSEIDKAHVLAAETLEWLQGGDGERMNLWIAAAGTGVSPNLDDVEFDFNPTVSNTSFAITIAAGPTIPNFNFINTAIVTVTWSKGGRDHSISLTGVAR